MIRPLEIEKDITDILRMCRAMHESSIFKEMSYSAEKIINLFNTAQVRDNYLVRVSENLGSIDGMFIGVVQEHFFSIDDYSIDLLLWVDPIARGKGVAKEFIEEYKEWASDCGVKMNMIGSSTGTDIEKIKKLYESTGYQCVGHNFILT